MRRTQSPIERALQDPTGAPLRQALRDGLDEGRIKEMWERIDHAPRRGPSLWLIAMTTAVLVATALLLVLGGRPEPRLALAEGGAPNVFSAEAAALTPRFDDGSSVTLARGARLEVLRNDRRSFVTALRRGEASFDVKPGGPRSWVVEAGELSVEVVGTSFRVERLSDGTRVSVAHGVVVVRGERVPNGAVRLAAGEQFRLAALASPVEPAIDPKVASPAPSARPITAESPSARPAEEPSPASSAVTTPRDEIDAALWAADAARARKDSADAAAHFERAFRLAPPGDTRRGLAGLSLARLAMGSSPAQAARVLRSCLADMPHALREDALARLVEAEARAGNVAAAQQAAEDYRRRFPSGARADEVRRWSPP